MIRFPIQANPLLIKNPENNIRILKGGSAKAMYIKILGLSIEYDKHQRINEIASVIKRVK